MQKDIQRISSTSQRQSLVGCRSPQDRKKMNNQETACLLWVAEAACYVKVEQIAIDKLIRKGVRLVESCTVFGQVVGVRFFEVQSRKEAA